MNKKAKVRRTIAQVLCLLFVSCGGGASAGEQPPAQDALNQPAPLTYAEILQWRDAVWAVTRGLPVRNNPLDTYDPNGKGTYLIQQENYTIESATPSLDVENNPIVSVTFNDVHAEGPRGTGLGMTLEEVLAAYQNNNPSLIGDMEFAALYVYDAQERADLPEAAWGLLMRNERGALSVEYAVSAPFAEADAYTDIMVSYVITEGYVTDMRVADFGDSILQEELRENVDTVRSIAADVTYDPQAGMQPPLHAEMFQREDLIFSGLDFLMETAEDVRTLLGVPKSEAMTSSEDGGVASLLITYPGLEFEFAQADGQQPAQLRALQITDPNFAGPRGVRVGDTLTDVLSSFRLEDESYQEPQTILYAPGESVDQPPFGLLEIYSEHEAVVRYAMPAPSGSPGEAIMLLITVENLRVTELYLYRWQVE